MPMFLRFKRIILLPNSFARVWINDITVKLESCIEFKERSQIVLEIPHSLAAVIPNRSVGIKFDVPY